MSRAPLGFFFILVMAVIWVAAVGFIAMVWSKYVTQGVFARYPGFPLGDCRWLFLGSGWS